MAKDFYHDELDHVLQKADEYTMYPSERVWKGIRKNLFWRRNWYSVTGSVLALCLLFLIPESFLSTFFYNAPKTTGKSAKNSSSTAVLSANPSHKLKAIPGVNTPLFGADPVPLTNQIALSVHTGNTISSGSPSDKLYGAKTPERPVAIVRNIGEITPPASLLPATSEQPKAREDDHAPAAAGVEVATEQAPEQYHGDVNWLQELAVIKLTHPKQSRFNLQFYFSPMVSYRTLTDGNKAHDRSTGSGPMAASQFDINQYVDHQPSVGVELGSNMLFKASNNLTFRTGLQLNYSRYTIKAYKVGYEKASIALSSFGRAADTITSYTTIRNVNGYLQEQLQNQYFQLSMPIGAELKLLGSKRFQINIAGTIQPTYLLLNDAYLLSTDYINYTKEPSLVRRWNVHSSAEAYISYQFANVRWQVGPQFRYQLLSSFTDRYPIKEYLMEYGIKFGISKTLK